MNQGRIFRGLAALFGTILAIGVSQSQAKEFPARPGEFVVQLKSNRSIETMANIGPMLGGKILSTVSVEHRIVVIERPAVEKASYSLANLKANPLVAIAEPNYIYKALGTSSAAPNDPEFGKLWGLENTGQVVTGDSGTFNAKPGVDIGARPAWQISTGAKNIVVAVIDTGVKWDHPDLMDNIYTNLAEKNGQPGIDDDGNGCIDDIHGCDFSANDGDPMDVYGHGTHVSGTIGARGNNNNGIVGVAWDVTILPVRFLGDDGSGSLEGAIKAIDYATKMHANIMNNSWGGGGFSQLLMDAIIRARDAGILFVAAAGNDSNDNDSSPTYPASFQVDNIIAVAAIDPTGQIADFSNFGKESVAIAAPGVDIVSYTTHGTESWSGTSMATPHVAGAAAVLLSQDMSQSYLTLIERLKNSARPMAALRGRVKAGMLNLNFALTNQVSPADPNDPYDWSTAEHIFASPHPFGKNANQEFVFQQPGVTRIAVHFTKFDTEGGYDKVTVKDKNGHVVGVMSGKLGDTFSPPVDGDTIILTYTSDGTVDSYGFDVGGLAYQ